MRLDIPKFTTNGDLNVRRIGTRVIGQCGDRHARHRFTLDRHSDHQSVIRTGISYSSISYQDDLVSLDEVDA